MYVVTVRFQAHPDKVEQFRELLTGHARSSREDEPGCRQFDFCVSQSDPTTFFVYEVYDDAAAFEAHKHSPHSARTRAVIDDLLVDRELLTWTRLDS